MEFESEQSKTDLEQQFPGIPFAFPIAMESYKTARERFDLMEKRGQGLIVFVTSIGLGVLALASKKTPPQPVSLSLIIAFLTYVVALAFAVGSQMYGKITGPDPRLLREKALIWDEWSFQSNMIYWAAIHFEANLTVIAQRAKMVSGTLLFGLLSLIFLAIWMI